MHSFHYCHGTLQCEDVDLEQVAEKFGTPLYVYSAGTILDHYQRLTAALAPLDRLICYAVKANSNGAVLRLLAQAGAGFDIVSGGELFRVLKAGGTAAKCTFAGVGKSREEIEYALEQGVFSFNIESEAELAYINEIARGKDRRAPIAIRINPDVDPHTHEYIATGSHETKFGIPLERAMAVYEGAAEMRSIEIVGVQMHIGSQITEAEPFAAAIEKVAPLVSKLKERYRVKFFSIGGGLGIVYESSFASGAGDWWKVAERGDVERAEASRLGPAKILSIHEYVNAILPALLGLNLQILLEPGRLLVGNAGVLLTRVRYIKQSGRRKFAIVDAGMNDLIRPALYHSYHEIIPVKEPSSNEGGGDSAGRQKSDARQMQKIDVVGPVCESGDFFAHDREMPLIAQGDLLAIMSAGAYGFAMASNYNSRPLPAEVMVSGDQYALVRKRQTYEDLTRGEVQPEWGLGKWSIGVVE